MATHETTTTAPNLTPYEEDLFCAHKKIAACNSANPPDEILIRATEEPCLVAIAVCEGHFSLFSVELRHKATVDALHFDQDVALAFAKFILGHLGGGK